MDILERYETILHQGLEELEPSRERSPEDDGPEEARLAQLLGNSLYRLTVEHGVAYTPFRETVIRLLVSPQEAAVRSSKGSRARNFAEDMESEHNLFLLALEMMPPDQPW